MGNPRKGTASSSAQAGLSPVLRIMRQDGMITKMATSNSGTSLSMFYPISNPVLHHLKAPNAPVQARRAYARRAGLTSPNPPAVACNRSLDALITWAPAVPRPEQKPPNLHKLPAPRCATTG